MKKAIFCATALMFGTIGFAQNNTVLLIRSGNDNDAMYQQVGE